MSNNLAVEMPAQVISLEQYEEQMEAMARKLRGPFGVDLWNRRIVVAESAREKRWYTNVARYDRQYARRAPLAPRKQRRQQKRLREMTARLKGTKLVSGQITQVKFEWGLLEQVSKAAHIPTRMLLGPSTALQVTEVTGKDLQT